MKEKDTVSPLLKQYFEIKAQYPEALLLYRVGDFYETFGEDAVKASRILGIVLTRKAAGGGKYTELAGVPYHAMEVYLPKLVSAGCKVAVCDQLEDPKLTKKLVKRGVTELVTPGVAYNDNILTSKENNYLAAFSFEKNLAGASFLDISTGTFLAAQGSVDYIGVLLSEFAPKEILIERSYLDGFRDKFGNTGYITPLDEWPFVTESAYVKLRKHFGTDNLKGFGIEDLPLGISAAGAILYYLEMTRHTDLGHINRIERIDSNDFVWMDGFTVRNLEIFHSLAGAAGTSLVDIMDHCSSPMGARKLRQYLARPLKDKKAINARYDMVEAFVKKPELLENVSERLREVGDLERIVAKAAAGRLLPREALQIARSLENTSRIRKALSSARAFAGLIGKLDDCTELLKLLTETLLPDAAAAVGKGDVISSSVDGELRTLRDTLTRGKDILLEIQQREKEATGIPSLKIGYNNVFGYYLEVRNMHKERVPQDWVRKQTLVEAERYITQELKSYEDTILGAEEKILAIETRIYGELVESIRRKVHELQTNADILSQLDTLASFAILSSQWGYCRPKINDGFTISIIQGRHPVIEQRMAEGESYIANDLYLDNTKQQIIILTGPNMAGKSAFLRQNALIVLMAQVGCFVPAAAAEIGVVDKIFTRVGASDNISRGESTFMVEMTESAAILNNISQRSLVLLDEIGRGTSTFDGMSIAWAIVEYLHEKGQGAKTIFATHYHELNELEEKFPRVHNYNISVKESDGKVIFLRKLCKGGVAHSFGIQVARIAGMPRDVVYLAEKKLARLESGAAAMSSAQAPKRQEGIQLSLYQLDDPLLLDVKETIKSLDINTMSPLDAFDCLRGLKKKLGL
ncbi:MAG: DNA mismatch repair protein MutS [Bacteroidales bacterium]|nr:DNA mismatch repair protein MutS [Candidatus Cacconaster scatequi]